MPAGIGGGAAGFTAVATGAIVREGAEARGAAGSGGAEAVADGGAFGAISGAEGAVGTAAFGALAHAARSNESKAGARRMTNLGEAAGSHSRRPAVEVAIFWRPSPQVVARFARLKRGSGTEIPMRFRLFGVDVQVQMFFWLTTAFFAYEDLIAGRLAAAAVWIAVVFVSVLVHELGHALAVKRHGIEPQIALHGMGGTTSWRPGASITRVDHILISLAGPFAGFALGGLLFALKYFAPGLILRLPPLAVHAVGLLLWVNIGWGFFNLIPVLPFDGGHVLEHALGPRRARLTAGISGLIAGAVTLAALKYNQWWIAMLFGMATVQSYQRFSASPEDGSAPAARRPAVPVGEEIPAELAAMLQTARSALAEEQLARAISIAQAVLITTPLPPRAAVLALEIIGWAHLLGDDPREAAKAVESAKSLGDVDAALVGATLLASGDLVAARKVLEGAMSKGDNRKEVAGPLIQVLIQQGEVARAAAVALDIVDTLSDDDVRKMAEIALEGRAFDCSARLFEQSFARARNAEDAYAAARAHALGGQHDRAVEWLRRAVEAGFSDRARAWSDAALEALRTGPDLEAVLPRP